MALIGFAISLAYQQDEGYNAYYSFVYFFHSVSAFLLMGLYLCDKMPSLNKGTGTGLDKEQTKLERVGHWAVVSTKGHLISKCPFRVIVSTKNQRILFKDFSPSL